MASADATREPACPDTFLLSHSQEIGLAGTLAVIVRALGTTPVADPRPLKKSETLEIRIPYATKTAFMAHCRAHGRSASEDLRALINQRLEAPQAAPSRRRLRPAFLGALIAAAVGAGAAPALARAGMATGFERLDADHDRRITLTEFQRLDRDRDGAISLAEYQR